MAVYRFRGALNAASFPLISILQGRTVIQPGMDNNVKTPRTFFGTDESAEYNVPQLFYCENVVPTAEGIQSVNYDTEIAAMPGAADFDQAITLRDADENTSIFVPARGKNYIYTANAGVWQSVTPIIGWLAKRVTRAYVNGRTFICYEGFGVYEYDRTTNTVNKLTLTLTGTGLTEVDIKGVGSSSNYLLAFAELSVLWSSLIDPTDFTPSSVTGAGNQIPQDLKGPITSILGISGGFIIYSSKNAVAAVFSNNIRSPFTFREVANAGGTNTYEQVTSDQNAGPHYAWTTGGLQKITIQGAEPVSAEINDFIAGRMYETWDPLTRTLTQKYGAQIEMSVKLTYIGSRFLVMSYATGEVEGFDYAIIYDTTLKRWGKLKITHVDCFSYPYPNIVGPVTYADLSTTAYSDLEYTSYYDLGTAGVQSNPPSKFTVAFLQADGTVKLLRMDYNKDRQDDAVAIFGKFQLTRAQVIGCQQVEVEGIYQDMSTLSQVFSLHLATSLDGYNLDNIQQMRLLNTAKKRAKYARFAVGLNFALIAQGTFALSSYIVEATNEGDE